MVLSNILSQTFYERYLPVFFKLIKFRYQILVAKRESISQQRTFRSLGTSEMVCLATRNLVLLLRSLGLRPFFSHLRKHSYLLSFFLRAFSYDQSKFFLYQCNNSSIPKCLRRTSRLLIPVNYLVLIEF